MSSAGEVRICGLLGQDTKGKFACNLPERHEGPCRFSPPGEPYIPTLLALPNEKLAVLATLAATWQKHPKWRLGQLVANLSPRDVYYVSDALLIDRARNDFGGSKVDSAVTRSDHEEIATMLATMGYAALTEVLYRLGRHLERKSEAAPPGTEGHVSSAAGYLLRVATVLGHAARAVAPFGDNQKG